MRHIAFLCLCFLFFASCGNDSFKIVKNPKPDAEGFLNKDLLQVSSVGYAPKDPRLSLQQRQTQSYHAALIRSRMRVIDYLLSELQTDNAEKYQAVVTRVGGRLSFERYDTAYSPELAQGGQRADGYFELFSIGGFVYTNTYTEDSGRCSMLYRVAKANLIVHAKNGFGIGGD
jgi:hypothetical protein